MAVVAPHSIQAVVCCTVKTVTGLRCHICSSYSFEGWLRRIPWSGRCGLSWSVAVDGLGACSNSFGGTILVGLTSGLIAGAVIAAVCTILYGSLWLRERRHT